MDDNRFFADVNLPFHVWAREGNRWVLRAAPQGEAKDQAPLRDAVTPMAGESAPVDDRRAA
jgi:hypothetical protein